MNNFSISNDRTITNVSGRFDRRGNQQQPERDSSSGNSSEAKTAKSDGEDNAEATPSGIGDNIDIEA